MSKTKAQSRIEEQQKIKVTLDTKICRPWWNGQTWETGTVTVREIFRDSYMLEGFRRRLIDDGIIEDNDDLVKNIIEDYEQFLTLHDIKRFFFPGLVKY